MAAIYPDLEGKSVLVTGGGSGIGASIVRAFARQKAKVGFLDIARDPSTRLVDELASQGFAVRYEYCDVTNIDHLRAAIGRIRAGNGPIRVLINNAAHDDRHSVESVTPEYWDDRIAVNLKHQFFAAQAVLPDMQAEKDGAIVNFGSISWMTAQGGMPVYTASKSAVLGLTRGLARDYGAWNIRVNAVVPGWIMTERQIEKWVTPQGEADLMKAQCLKRKLYPDDISRVVVFLASEEASACTSQHYVVDGGRT
ncbi:SDR family oxidoreductase [Bradyrhizobium sp. JYMT SZCCT0180]|uniref:SDR family NAD(P)-dependent oxidoreductase n=1 Tax=Bradyrhizobium sp. JYMT SZCCT0180 TaxID=2807666 RepID=UPI001BA989F3|nr:SDR family oxidoreductase [Bradyrhizobium sp. JYMT SZCCT0180]MBR1210597.1 SDR family oxidoreductase [Bradyrhizobium sp. JYMT SZCCT0180]